MTIISASYKTDIPAFYGGWFENRLRDGNVQVRNPFNNKLSLVSLLPEDVDGFVFWTRNIAPFYTRLEKLISGQYPFYVQFTVTGYPRVLETSVPEADVAVGQIKELAHRYGARAVVWRYDPILISSLTPVSFHLKNFASLSGALSGFTNEVVVSFAQFYQKTKRNLGRLAAEKEISFDDPETAIKQDLLGRLSQIAHSNGQKLTVCTQPDLQSAQIEGAACINSERLGLNKDIKIQGNRPGCLCALSKDIGGYDTCVHGCVYCYAVANRDRAKANYKEHQETSGFLS